MWFLPKCVSITIFILSTFRHFSAIPIPPHLDIYLLNMFSSISLPNIFISLLLCSAAVEGHSRYADRFEHARRHAPKDFRRNMQLHNRQILQGTASAASGSGAAQSTFVSYNNYTSGRWRAPAVTSAAAVVVVAGTTVTILQPKIVTVTVPIYQICEITGSACSTAFQTATTTICSTVLTGFFTRATVTDCNQSITFSTKTSFSLTSTVVPAVMTPIAKRQAASTSTFAQTIVSYYVAPWQSIAANKPDDIRVVVCSVDSKGTEICTDVQEVWLVRVEVVPVLITSTFTISNFFSEVRTSSSA